MLLFAHHTDSHHAARETTGPMHSPHRHAHASSSYSPPPTVPNSIWRIAAPKQKWIDFGGGVRMILVSRPVRIGRVCSPAVCSTEQAGVRPMSCSQDMGVEWNLRAQTADSMGNKDTWSNRQPQLHSTFDASPGLCCRHSHLWAATSTLEPCTCCPCFDVVSGRHHVSPGRSQKGPPAVVKRCTAHERHRASR